MCLNFFSSMILKYNSYYFHVCYHVLIKSLNSLYHIVRKLNLHQIAINFIHMWHLTFFEVKQGLLNCMSKSFMIKDMNEEL